MHQPHFRKTFETQRLQNLRSLDERSRFYIYSSFAQAVKPLADLNHERWTEMERRLDNQTPGSFDTEDLDRVYEIPVQGEIEAIYGMISATSSVAVVRKSTDIDEFWYGALPTRLEVLSRDVEFHGIVYQGDQASKSWDSDRKHYGSNLFEPYPFSWFVQGIPDPDKLESTPADMGYIDTSVQDRWGHTYKAVSTDATSTRLGMLWKAQEATSSQVLDFRYSYRNTGTSEAPGTMFFEYGLRGLSTSTQSSVTVGTHWQEFRAYHNDTRTGTAFFHAYKLMNPELGVVFESLTAEAYDWRRELREATSERFGLIPGCIAQGTALSWTYVEATNAGGLLMSTAQDGNLVSGIVIQGKGLGSFSREELVPVPYNGVHRTFSPWAEINRVGSIKIDTGAIWWVRNHDVQSSEAMLCTEDVYTDKMEENLTFFSFGTQTDNPGEVFLQWKTFPHAQLDYLRPEDGLEVREACLLKNDQGATLGSFVDACYIPGHRLFVVLDTTAGCLHMFDHWAHWPGKDACFAHTLRTPDVNHRIMDPEERHWAYLNETRILKSAWPERSQHLSSWRWIVQKPDGSLHTLDNTNTLIPLTGNTWRTLDAGYSMRIEEWLYFPETVELTIDDPGDWIVILESEIIDPETQDRRREKDVYVISAFVKEAVGRIELPEFDTDPIGLDLLPNGDLRFFFERQDNPLLWDTAIVRLRFDYWMQPDNDFTVILREAYPRGVFIKLEGDPDDMACFKAIYLKTASSTLTKAEVDCSMVIVDTSAGLIPITLPIVSNLDNGKTVVIKRWGADDVEIYPGAGATIDGGAQFDLLTDKDAVTLTYYHGLLTWIVS